MKRLGPNPREGVVMLVGGLAALVVLALAVAGWLP